MKLRNFTLILFLFAFLSCQNTPISVLPTNPAPEDASPGTTPVNQRAVGYRMYGLFNG